MADTVRAITVIDDGSGSYTEPRNEDTIIDHNSIQWIVKGAGLSVFDTLAQCLIVRKW